MDLDPLLKQMVEQGASDLFLKVGNHPFLRINGQLIPVGNGEERLHADDVTRIASELMGPHGRQTFHADRELNFAFDRATIGRFRANVLWQRGTMALVIRRVNRAIPSFEELRLPAEVLARLMGEPHGLVLITGATGSGKSTTTAAMLQYVNQHVARHIVTLEDPIEFQYEEQRAIINQREVGTDTRSFSEGLRNVLRQSPDILYLSDLRDRETMESALLAAEAGQLVLSCLHTTNATTTIERIVAFFPSHQHQLIRLRLSQVLRGIVSLRLLAARQASGGGSGSGRVPACEILLATPTMRDHIREGQTELLPAAIHDGGMLGMQTLTQALYALYRAGEVTLEEALRHADSPQDLQLMVKEIRATRDVH